MHADMGWQSYRRVCSGVSMYSFTHACVEKKGSEANSGLIILPDNNILSSIGINVSIYNIDSACQRRPRFSFEA